jgi:hypothetical protein
MLYKYLDCEYCSLFLPSFSRERPLMLNGKFLGEITNAYMQYNYDVEADFSAKPVINSYVKGAKLVHKQFRKNYKIRKAWVVNCMETKQNGKHYKYEVMIVECKLPDFYEMYRDLKCIFEKTNPELARIIYYESGLGKILLEKNNTTSYPKIQIYSKNFEFYRIYSLWYNDYAEADSALQSFYSTVSLNVE